MILSYLCYYNYFLKQNDRKKVDTREKVLKLIVSYYYFRYRFCLFGSANAAMRLTSLEYEPPWIRYLNYKTRCDFKDGRVRNSSRAERSAKHTTRTQQLCCATAAASSFRPANPDRAPRDYRLHGKPGLQRCMGVRGAWQSQVRMFNL